MSATIGNGLFGNDLYPSQVPSSTQSPLQTLASLQAKNAATSQSQTPQGNGMYTGQQPVQQPSQFNAGGVLNSNSTGANVLNTLNGTSGQSPLAMLSGAFGGPTTTNGAIQQVGSALAPAGQYGPYDPQTSILSMLPSLSSDSGSSKSGGLPNPFANALGNNPMAAMSSMGGSGQGGGILSMLMDLFA